MEKGGKSDGNTRGHVVFIARTSKDSSKRMEMCDGKWETNCSNSILNLGHVSILDTLSEESLPRMRSDVHVSLYTPEEGCWLLPTLSSFLSLPFFSPLPFFVLSCCPGNDVVRRHRSNNELDGECNYEWNSQIARFLKNSWRDFSFSFFFFLRSIHLFEEERGYELKMKRDIYMGHSNRSLLTREIILVWFQIEVAISLKNSYNK